MTHRASGSWLNVPAYYALDDDYLYFASTGTVPLHFGHHNEFQQRYDFINEEDMWNRMYVRPRPVIIVCGYCKSHNAISNPTCVRCGAPMGYGTER